MRKTFSVEELLWAFIEQTENAKSAVAVSMAGQPWGYVRIKGPAGNHQVIIERYNATVCFTDVHRALPGVEPRPSTTPPTKISEHPLGSSSGPSMSPFLWGISAEALRQHYATPAEFADAVVQACAQAGTPW